MPYFGSEPGETSAVVGAYNYLINGDMRISQRATSFVSGANNDDVYTLDRWNILSEANDTIDVTQTTTVPSNGALKSIGLDVEIANNMFGIVQFVESINCGGLIGNEVTLSFQAKVSNARIGDVRAYILAWDGTADAVTSDVVATWNDDANPTFATNWTAENTGADLGVTTDWAKYSVTATIDTSNTTNVAVFIANVDDSTSAGDFLYITDVQLEKGNTASDYVRKPYSQELADCRRYYQTAGAGASGGARSGTSMYIAVEFGVEMRTAPTATLLDTTMFVISTGGYGTNASSGTIDSAWNLRKTGASFDCRGFDGGYTQHHPVVAGESNDDQDDWVALAAEL